MLTGLRAIEGQDMKKEERTIMRARILKVVIFCILFQMYGSGVYALNLLGSPTAELKQGQIEFGFEHSYSRFAVDFDFTGGTSPMPDFGNNRMKMNTTYNSFAYGFTDSIEGFATVGKAGIVDEEHQRLNVDGQTETSPKGDGQGRGTSPAFFCE